MNFPNKNNKDIKGFVESYAEQVDKAYKSIDLDELDIIAELLISSIMTKKTIYTCGNGGSSAISEHFVCDFLKGASTDTSISPIIHSLTSNIPTLTAIANDIDYESIFSYQLDKYANKDDVLICVSSSGNSKNIINALTAASAKGIKTISFVGFSGGEAMELSDFCIHIPVNNYGIVEDSHHSLMHILSQYVRLKTLSNPEDLGNIIF